MKQKLGIMHVVSGYDNMLDNTMHYQVGHIRFALLGKELHLMSPL